ncbi:hypothetical protein CJP74_02095 [Psittacicella melopsittaci]|uniref:HTH lysR-type domain-containing protein n=1 Tax=Psittacicella melopsittaci TaxID=2028576 RepID=A0A3A1YB53_9GAMM|nr:LysR family transcriptional regulator [Psittacicella melopsittaci]RIY33347.1 hypothetical protein CJP74_02095 [Psittacicella melopsittaci]
MLKNFNDLYLFLVVVKSGGFTATAKILNITTSAVSHGITNLEKRLQTKLLNRSTRSVSCTEAGQQLFDSLEPLYSSIEQQLEELERSDSKVSGTIRFNASENICNYVLYPKLAQYMADNPQLNFEFYCDSNFIDIIEHGYDFGVRLGEALAQGMVAVQLTPPLQIAMVASPEYLAKHGTPESVSDLNNHVLGAVCLGTKRQLLNWEFIQNQRIVSPQLNYRIRSNNYGLLKRAALEHKCILWGFRDEFAQEIASGQLVELFTDIVPTYDPLYLYFAQNRYKSRAKQEIIDLLRYKEK